MFISHAIQLTLAMSNILNIFNQPSNSTQSCRANSPLRVIDIYVTLIYKRHQYTFVIGVIYKIIFLISYQISHFCIETPNESECLSRLDGVEAWETGEEVLWWKKLQPWSQWTTWGCWVPDGSWEVVLLNICLFQLIGVKSCFLFSLELKSLDFLIIFVFLWFLTS